MNYCPSQSVPEDDYVISPQSERILELLENAALNQAMIDLVMSEVAELESLASHECAACASMAAKAEQEYWDAVRQDEPIVMDKCDHGLLIHECNACLAAGDFAYKAMREGRKW